MQEETIVTKTQNAIENYEKFVNILMHDLRVPIANMMQLAELITDDDLPRNENIEYSTFISKEGKKALKMIQSYLTLQKIESGKMTLAKKSKAINELMIELESTFSSFKSLGSKLFVQSFVEKKEVEMDEDLFLLAVTNLFKNAAEASGKTDINVYLHEEDEMFCLSVVNQGEIPMEIRGHLFEKFITGGKEGGTGLGLFGAKLIVNAHGGNLYYEPFLGGTKFTIKIPFN